MYQPKISVIVPVYNTRPDFLDRAIASVRHQTYANWELCIACATDGGIYTADNRIRVEAELNRAFNAEVKVTFTPNLGISGNTNAALELATGDYVAFLDCDDVLTPNALQQVVNRLAYDPSIDFLYSDEDKINESEQRFGAYRKPDWSPDTLMSKMYTCHLGVYRTELVRSLGGLRMEYDGAQDYDLALRVVEKTDRIVHIPEILYSWRVHSGSTAGGADAKPHAHIAAVAAVRAALERRGEEGVVEPLSIGMHNVRYAPKDPDEKVSIIIPTKDSAAMVDDLIRSIFTRTLGYSNFEVLLVDNRSEEQATADMIARWSAEEPERFRCVRDDAAFNFSAINNRAVEEADGSLLLFLNNDMVVISPHWLRDMVGYAQRESIGVVGAKLLYDDATVQHAGVVVGIGGVAGHVFHKVSDHDAGYFGQAATVTNYSAVTGACMMMRREVFEQVRGFEEDLAVAFNDVDLCLRIRNAGYRNVYLPFVKLFHFESKTRGYEDTPDKLRRFRREEAYMHARWGKALAQDPCYNPGLSLTSPYATRLWGL